MLSPNQMPKLVYLTHRRDPGKPVTLTLPGVLTTWVPGSQSWGAVERHVERWDGAATSPAWTVATWDSIEPQDADTSIFLLIFADFKKAEKYGIDFRTWLRYFLGRGVERGLQE